MIQSIALWLAKELLKFAAGSALQRSLPRIMPLLDDALPFRLISSQPKAAEAAITTAAMRTLRRPPTETEQAVIRLLWDPITCALNRSTDGKA